MGKTILLVCLAALAPCAAAYADQGGFTNAGGSLSSSNVADPQGALSIAGTTLTFLSADGSTVINATLTNPSTVESCYGGGRGGHITCVFTFTSLFTGTLTVNGSTQAIVGSTSQHYGSTTPLSGTTGYNSAYTPFYFSNSGQLLRADDLNGSNLVSYGTQGSGVGQFYGAYGIAVDALGRIYVADTYNDRIVRIDDFNGTNWTEFGSYGSSVGQFADPQGLSVDADGRIYVMDTGNNRLVRMDDMSGTNWTEFSGGGSGDLQLAQYVASVAFDASGRIYIADTGNKRIVRMDDMTGTNWTTLTQSQPAGMYIYSFGSPVAVAVDAGGRIYVADSSYQPLVVRVDDMTGANWKSVALGAGATPHSLAVDASGMVLVGGGGAQTVDNMDGVQTSSSALTDYYGPYYVFGATPVPLPAPLPAAIGFSPATLSFTQNVGTTSAPQTIAITNFGGSPLNSLAMSVSGGFAETNDCPATLAAGSSCAVTVTFTPAGAGGISGTLTVTDDSFNLGSSQALTLDGEGTFPAAATTPASLTFPSQIAGTTSTPRTITLQSVGTGPLTLGGIAASGPFAQTNTCSSTLAAGASCTIQVTFTPLVVGSATGSITITDDAGTQVVALAGSGSAPVTLSTTSLGFGTLGTGSTSAPKNVTLSNRMNAALSFSSIGVTGPFVIVSSTCGAGIAAHGTCSVGVAFAPTTVGAATGSLMFIDSAVTSPQTVALTGTGSLPVTLSTSSVSFGSVTVGTTSSTRTVTVTNRQSAALTFSSVATTAAFNVASTTCVGDRKSVV